MTWVLAGLTPMGMMRPDGYGIGLENGGRAALGRPGFAISRRRFLAAIGGSALPAAVLATPRRGAAAAPPTSVRLEDYVKPDRPGGTDQTAEFAKLLGWLKREAAANRPHRLTAGPGRWQISDDFPIDWDGFFFEGQGEKTVIEQLNHERGLFRLFGSSATVRGLTRVYQGALVPITGRYYGFSAHQRTAAVIVHGERCTIEDITVVNSHTAICLRGPVASFEGRTTALTDDGEHFDWSVHAQGNTVRRLSAKHCQIGVSGNMQRDLTVEGVTCRDTVRVMIPPHAFYMEPGGPDGRKGGSIGVAISGVDDAMNPFGPSVKLEGFTNFKVSIDRVDGVAGVLVLNRVHNGSVKIGGCTRIGLGAPFNAAMSGAQINGSTNVTVDAGSIEGAPGARLNGAAIGTGSSNVLVRGMQVACAASPKANTAYGFQVRGHSDARFEQCGWRIADGLDDPMFFCDATSHITLDEPQMTGGAKLVRAELGADVRGKINRALIRGQGLKDGGADFKNLADSVK